MFARIDGRPVERALAVMRPAVLTACLGAMLVAAYGLVLHKRWSTQALPYLIAACGLALVMGRWSRRSATRVRSADEVALMFGAASMILGLGAAMLIGYGLTLQISEATTRLQTLAYERTRPSDLVWSLAFAAPAALSGGLGLWIARRRDRAAGKASLAATAARFSAVGLGSAGLIATLVAVAAVVRWLTWG